MSKKHKKLKRLIDKRALSNIHFSTDNVKKAIFGLVLDTSENFCLIRECIDFELKAFIIIRLKNITKIEKSTKEKFFTKIYQSEKLTDIAFSFDKIPLNSFKEIFTFIKEKHKYAIVESAFDGINDFCIGEIDQINTKSVSMFYFNILGEVDNKALKIPYKEIINIEFDSNYINTFRKYLK